MRQYDLCRIPNGRGIPFAVILQHDWLSAQRTCVVAPVLPATNYKAMEILHPRLEIDGKNFIIGLDLITTIPRGEIGPVVCSCENMRGLISRGIDRLIYGN